MKTDLFPLILSFKVAFGATLMSILLGIPVAYFLSKMKNAITDFFDSLSNLPVILPPTVLGYYLLVSLGRQSMIGKFLEDHFDLMIVFTPKGAVIASSIVSIPYLIKAAKVAFSGIDQDLINAARILGRNEFSIFITVILPLSWRGIIAGISMSFARAIGDFGATLMVAGSIPGKTVTMSIAIYNSMQSGDTVTANFLVGVMTFFAVITLFIINRLDKNKRKIDA